VDENGCHRSHAGTDRTAGGRSSTIASISRSRPKGGRERLPRELWLFFEPIGQILIEGETAETLLNFRVVEKRLEQRYTRLPFAAGEETGLVSPITAAPGG
jgi:hypothetical protein